MKALYGLKQGARNWYEALHEALKKLGFTRTEADHGVFYKEVGKDIIILAIHVNDGIITGSCTKLISEFKQDMNAIYKLTDLGAASWLLGIKITRDLANKTLSLSQHAYINAIVTRFNFNDFETLSYPYRPLCTTI